MSSDEHDISRRGFLKIVGATGAAPLLGSLNLLGQDTAATSQASVRQVPTRPLGKTGVNVSILCFGTTSLGGNLLMLKQAVKHGVTYWDTANGYEGGNSEKAFGKYLAKNSSDRKKLFIATKTESTNVEKLEQGLTAGLQRLQTDYVDLFHMHGMENPNCLTPEVKAWSEKMKKSGKIRFFGFSCHTNMENMMDAAAKAGFIDAVLVTYNYRIMNSDKMKAAVEACVKAGVGITAMKTQATGPLKDTYDSEHSMVSALQEKKNFTPQQAKLKAVWENQNIASICSLMTTSDHLTANVAAAMDKVQLTDSERRILSQHADKTTCRYCAGCGEICSQAVNGQVPVRDVMRYLMYFHNYGEQASAREMFNMLPATVRSKLASTDYSQAEKLCPHALPIAKLMDEAMELLA